ncbi:MAG TPA: GTPase Era [Longimicrobiales bacterium]
MAGEASPGETREPTRAGYVALVGRPNVGKSTLLNAILGEKLSIVTPKAQTTRDRVMGIYTTDRAQIVFVDTPGLLEPRYLLQESMLEAALGAIRESDAVLLLLDATRPEETPPAATLEVLRSRRPALFVAINKVDAAPAGAVEALARWSRQELDCEPLRISALTGEGVAELTERLIQALPVSEFLYPPDDIAVQPVRFFVAELIRETVFEEYREEIPYATVVRIEEFRENTDPVYIRAVLYVEREGQKAILIGRQGAGIKALGQRAREKVEAFLGARVYLDLWVKVLPGWRRKAEVLRRFGYQVSDESARSR